MNSIIQYYSTNLKAPKVSFREALLKGLAPDRGLYMPDRIPELTLTEIMKFSEMSYPEIGFNIIERFIKDEIPSKDLYSIVNKAYNFDIPIVNVYNRNYIMRLDQGPTASFKDFAARLMGLLMQYFLKMENRKMLILTATSGDTGSAIANAFYELDNINVVILYPEGEVTDRQRKQMTTLHKNISVLSVNGKFDDCQALVKKAFSDKDLDNLCLSSANSINIGRLLPQSLYYFYAWSRLAKSVDDKIIFSVPSGNFGNLMGGLLAKHMGLPVSKFIISTNENNEVPIYFREGIYKTIVPSRNCISSAMNVGHPSNMARVTDLYGGMMDENGTIVQETDKILLKKDMFAVDINDEETKQMIKKVYHKHSIILEPHGAVAWAGLQKYFNSLPSGMEENLLTVTLETAHPAKFPKEIQEILSVDPELPPSLSDLDGKKEEFMLLSNDYQDFKKYLLTNYNKF